METVTCTAGLQRPRRSLENFRGDFEKLAGFMQRSWGENECQPLLYTAEVLSSYFSYPGATFALAPTLYEDSRILGFAAGFPRRVLYQGRALSTITTAFLTVAVEHKKSGYGIVLWSELVRRAREAGYDGVLSFAIDGEPMSNMMSICYGRMQIPAKKIFSAKYLTHLIIPKQLRTSQNPATGWSLDDFLEVASQTANSASLGRIWSLKEVEWQCQRRGNSVVVSHSSNARRGFLTGYLMSVADKARTKALIVEDVLWNGLPDEERLILVHKLVDQAAFFGARMVIVPLQGYADPAPFYKSRFLHSKRLLHVYLGIFSEAIELEPVDSVYVDIF